MEWLKQPYSKHIAVGLVISCLSILLLRGEPAISPATKPSPYVVTGDTSHLSPVEQRLQYNFAGAENARIEREAAAANRAGGGFSFYGLLLSIGTVIFLLIAYKRYNSGYNSR